MEGSLRLFALSALPLFGPSEIRWGWAHDAVVEHLEAVTNGEIRNLVIDLPPRCLKSSLVSVCWPCWEWLRRPDLRYLFSSYDLNLTIRDNNYAREVIKSGWYQKRWADRYQISSSADAKRLFENDRTGRRLATSVSGTSKSASVNGLGTGLRLPVPGPDPGPGTGRPISGPSWGSRSWSIRPGW